MYQIDYKNPITIHFIGIGGISMSGIAELLLKEGFSVRGSDEKHSSLTSHLESLGIKVFYGNRASNIDSHIDLIVYTAAVKSDNPEFSAAAASGIPMLTRAELLGQIMLHYKDAIGISGTHGKTTTTSMLSLIFLEAAYDPTILVGGILPTISGNLHYGKSEYFIVEACEYTNSFLKFHPAHEIILNIDADHLDFFKDLDDIRNSFREFARLIPSGGLLVLNGDIENKEALFYDLPCRPVTFGVMESCHTPLDQLVGAAIETPYDFTAADISYDENGFPDFSIYKEGSFIGRVHLQVCGVHNIANAASAIAMACTLGISPDACARGLARFTGTKRRFEKKGELAGITIMDDYAHHPSEIRATLCAARSLNKSRIICVFQPHTYSRTKALLADFAEALSMADLVVLTDIYPAREIDPGDISSQDLMALIQKKGKEVYHFSGFNEIETFLLQKCYTGDLLITMGAGDVCLLGESLLGL